MSLTSVPPKRPAVGRTGLTGQIKSELIQIILVIVFTHTAQRPYTRPDSALQCNLLDASLEESARTVSILHFIAAPGAVLWSQIQ